MDHYYLPATHDDRKGVRARVTWMVNEEPKGNPDVLIYPFFFFSHQFDSISEFLISMGYPLGEGCLPWVVQRSWGVMETGNAL